MLKAIFKAQTTGVIMATLFLLASSSYVYAQREHGKEQIKYLTSITGYEGGIQFERPNDIFVDSYGDIFITDFYKEAVFIFDKDYLPVAKIDKANGLSGRPISVASNEDGTIFVSRGSGHILKFNIRGDAAGELKLSGVEGSESLIVKDINIDKDGNIYLACGTAGLVVLDKKASHIQTIQPEETKRDQQVKSNISRVSIGKDNKIYLLSEAFARIYVYDQQGNYITRFGSPGGTAGKLSRPQGIAADKNTGLAYVIDYMRHCFAVYNEEGKYLFDYGGQGTSPGWFNYPKGIFLNSDGILFVVDSFNKRIQVFKTSSSLNSPKIKGGV